jgi:hypothetical protein
VPPEDPITYARIASRAHSADLVLVFGRCRNRKQRIAGCRVDAKCYGRLSL